MRTRAERAALHNSARPTKRNLQSSKSLNGTKIDTGSASSATQSITVEGSEYFIPMETEKPETTINEVNKRIIRLETEKTNSGTDNVELTS
tara:strand:+ start:2154 stop:2426 length:273 start_codon:yes stop_codon:yes gene_type:complete